MVQVGDKQLPWKPGLTVDKLIKEFDDPYRYVVVRLNGRVISEPQFTQTLVPDQAQVLLIPMIAGG